MSESMAIESLLSKFLAAKLETAACGTRLPIYTGGGTNHTTDLDAWATASRRGVLAVGQCKVQGPATAVWKREPVEGLLDGNYESSTLAMVRALFSADNHQVSEDLSFSTTQEEPWAGLERIEIWLVANLYVAPADQGALDDQFSTDLGQVLAGSLPREGIEVVGYIRPTASIVLEALRQVDHDVTNGRGRRFGDEQLDILREIIRYHRATGRGGGHGLSAEIRDWLKDQIRDIF